MINHNFNYLDIEYKELRDEMFIMHLKKIQCYYMGSVIPEHRKEIAKAFDFQLESVVYYLKLIREGINNEA